MGAFDTIDIIIDVILIVLGIVSIVCPKVFTKKDERDNPEKLKQTKILGVLEVVLGIVFIIMTVSGM